jgi:uracil-DNA glycosylase family 4
MIPEQPDLFADLQPIVEQENKADPKQAIIDYGTENQEEQRTGTYVSFLPGIKAEQAWLDIKDFDQLKSTAGNCNLCRLRSTCNGVVFGEGPVNSRMMLIGEVPGHDEDLTGRPFVGKAGQLLDKILLAAEIKREDIYIANVVKCRPPQNRLPDAEEVKTCKGYLEAQIRFIKPELIICLGALASQVVIDPQARITKIRGKWFQRGGIKIMAVFHPAALLRNPDYKRPTWKDFKLIRDEYYSSKK